MELEKAALRNGPNAHNKYNLMVRRREAPSRTMGRLPCAATTYVFAILRDARLRRAPQDEDSASGEAISLQSIDEALSRRPRISF
jgi:hypothetical protein